LVIFLFLRRFVATLIPTLSLPISLVGAISLLWAFGYTIDNISLLGLTLAVGLVVDDAIVMLENIMRHVEEGMPPFQAALLVALATFVATGWLFASISKGFFPEEDIGQIRITTEASEDTSFPEMVRLQDRVATLLREDPNVWTVSSFNGGTGAQNTGRMFL